jgi:hypothetical protein
VGGGNQKREQSWNVWADKKLQGGQKSRRFNSRKFDCWVKTLKSISCHLIYLTLDRREIHMYSVLLSQQT